ncbi:hypothetical protein D5086_005437 [Populus alba]|uniref:Uncharacterized protein n=3 Tax=Populus TaxID=3689 RepID=A0A4U5QMX1_POPAL|nr:protein NPGR2-like [Populus alba]XP_034916104.1 protein NPGR2-like [Populus alba]KAJ7009031.1 protein NPGR2-like [Populus alba x Populus x berolinensis]TKS12184.1 hypothetical protein D5086_0000067700 [Populus alba]
MKSKFRVNRRKREITRQEPERLMECLSSGDQSRAVDGMTLSSESLATKENPAGAYSSKNGVLDLEPDTSNLEEAELSLRGRGSLNYEEARALLGRMEYQKGNIEAALHVFEGINIAAVTPRMKVTLAKRQEDHKRHSQSFATPSMSIHAASLLMEAIFLKAKSLQHLGRFREAAQSCKVIVDIVESSFSEGMPENFAADFKLQETLNKAVELLPELWKLADSPREAIMSYRRALLHHWNLDVETTARIQKDFAIFLLYSGGEASPPNLRSLMDSSFAPKNNIEEAILLLMILLRKMILTRIEWDPSILDHLSFTLSVSGGLKALASQVEELLPGIIDRRERYHILSLCYYGAGEELVALDLLRKLLHSNEDPKRVPALLMASKICGKTSKHAEEGINYARRALQSLENDCNQLESVANCLLGVSLSAHSQVAVADSERVTKQCEALEALESAGRMTKMQDSNILYHLSLENAEQRKLDVALYYAKHLLKLESGSNIIRGWLLLARILSAQRQYKDAETVINAALDQTGKWDQGELLRTKAKLQIAQGQLENGIESYIQLLAVLQIQSKSFGPGTKLYKDNGNPPSHLELEVWHDLASVYMRLSRWHDAETCLSKSKAISSYSASRCHTTGVLYEQRGLYKEALKAFVSALDIDPTHVPSLVSTAVVLRRLSMQSNATRSFLMAALRLDRMNSSAWYNLGLLYKAEGAPSPSLEAADCFEAATFLEETAPVEPFR